MKMKNNAFSPVVSVVLATAVVVSTIGVIFVWGAPYIESIEGQSARKNIESQMNVISGVVNNLISSDVGSKKMNPVSFSGGSISSGTYQDRTVMMYSREPDYNFTVTDINDDSIGIEIIEPVNGVGDLSALLSTPSNCFLAGTQVLMADGSYKNIEGIERGDIVISYCEKEKRIVEGRVIKLFEYELDVETDQTEYYLIINEQLRVTPDHRFYSNKEWIEAGRLTERHNLFTYDSQDYTYPISSIGQSHGLAAQYYDLVIDEGYPYFVYFVDDDVNVLVQSREISNPPELPSNPSPADYATDVWVETSLSWTGGNPDGETYDFYFGKTNPPTFRHNNGNLTTLFPLIGRLEYDTMYYWRIVAIDNDDPSLETYGPIWRFTTEMGPSITVISPNGGEAWREDSIQDITWSSADIPLEANVIIKLYNESGFSAILDEVQNSGCYTWDIANNPRWMQVGYHKIKIEYGDIYDFSDRFFMVYSSEQAVLTLAPDKLTNRDAIFVGKLENISGQVRFRYREEGTTSWIYPSNWHGSYDDEFFYECIYALLPYKSYEYQALVKNEDFEIEGNLYYFRTYLHEGLPVITAIPEESLFVNPPPLQGDGIWIIGLPPGLSGTFAIDLYDITDPANSIYFGTIWVFDSNSLEYTRTSSGRTDSYVFEKGGILRYVDGRWSVKENKFIYGTDTFFSINMIQTNFSEFSASTGSSNRINLRLSSDLKSSFIGENGLIYNLRLQFFGEYKDSWMEYLSNNYNFESEDVGSAPSSLRYNSADGSVNLALTHSIANLRFQY